VEIFKKVSIDWLGKKWLFFGLSWFLIALGALGYVLNKGLKFGIDFTGGTVIYAKFPHKPESDRIRKALATDSISTPVIQAYGKDYQNKVQIRMQTIFGGDDIHASRKKALNLLRKEFDPANLDTTQIDFNNIKFETGFDVLPRHLLSADPDNLKSQNKTSQDVDDYYRGLAQRLMDFRDNEQHDGFVGSLDDLKSVSGVSSPVIASLKQGFYAGPVAVQSMDSIGAIVGSDLRRRAELAVLASFAGMLIYIWFRFKFIYGVAAVVALIHDIAVTLGLFALTQKEISLTVIAALLTLVGYSMNDTIVVFDRVRENLRLLRKEPLLKILNLSINQTLSRTIMTSGMTFLSVFALYVFGGEVLHGFSFALTVGIIIGTYSSIGIASPIVEWWYRSVDQKSKQKVA
jgi:preprotein translocase subunit SecF